MVRIVNALIVLAILAFPLAAIADSSGQTPPQEAAAPKQQPEIPQRGTDQTPFVIKLLPAPESNVRIPVKSPTDSAMMSPGDSVLMSPIVPE